MRKKINHPHAIWILAMFSLGLNLLVLFSAKKILAETNSSDQKENKSTQTVNTDLSTSTSNTVPTTATPKPIFTPTPTPKPTIEPTPVPTTSADKTVTTTSTSTVSTSVASETMMPAFSFNNVPNKNSLSGDVKIQGKVDGATAVEFYLVRNGSISPEFYAGRGVSNDNKLWTFTLLSKQFPDGEYELFAKIKNVYGSYKSGKIILTIKNLSAAEKNDETTQTTSLTTSSTTTNATTNSSSTSTSSSNSTTSSSSAKSSSSGNNSNTPAQQMAQLNAKETQIENSQTLSVEEKSAQLEKIATEKQEIKKNFVSRQEAERILVKNKSQMTMEEKDRLAKVQQQFKEDTDGDGLPDFEEERIGTDVFSADSDGDGYLDGDEVKEGFNPLLASAGDQSDRIVFEEPKEKGAVSPVYEVKKVSLEKGAVTDAETGVNKDVISLQGKALPNSFVTLYIYSSGPIVVTVKADENGDWQYSLDKELEDGEHQVFATVTDNTGKITAKSEAFSFVKTARAVESIGNKKTDNNFLENNASPLERMQIKIAKFILIFSFISLFLAIASIVLFIKHREFFQKKIDALKKHE